MGTHNLSQHVHRIGYHFPSTVVAAVCSELGLYLTSAGKAVPFHTLGGLQKDTTASSEVDQITINTEARDAIRDLFPNIPDNDLNQIIKTAFQKVSALLVLESWNEWKRSQEPDICLSDIRVNERSAQHRNFLWLVEHSWPLWRTSAISTLITIAS